MTFPNTKPLWDALDKEKDMTRDAGSTCQCNNNEKTPASVNEITRLKVVIEQKDAALQLANRRADTYRDTTKELLAENRAVREENDRLKEKVDAYSRSNGMFVDTTAALREENKRLNSRIVEQNDWLMRHKEEIRLLKEENERLKSAVEISVDGHTKTSQELVQLVHENKRLKELNIKLDMVVGSSGKHLISLVKRIEDATAILNPKFE